MGRAMVKTKENCTPGWSAEDREVKCRRRGGLESVPIHLFQNFDLYPKMDGKP